jgi:RHS repeat-associated protein
MPFNDLQLEQRSNKTFWRLSKRRRDYCCNHSNFIKNILSDNLINKQVYDVSDRVVFSTDSHLENSTVNGKDTTYNYDSNDRLLNEITDTKKIVYGYDHTQQTSKTVTENGEIISTTTFEYDQQGRMSVVTITIDNRQEITKYEYSADGIRVSAEHEIYIDGQLQSKTKTEYLNDPNSLTGYSQVLRQTEYDAEGNVIKTISYVIGHQRISQTIEIGGEKVTHYFTFDGHGSTRVLLDLTGAIVQLYSFDAYGNSLGFNTSEALTEFLYSGEQFDSKIGQQYLRQRYYDPSTGRFNRLDPFFGNQFDPQSFHKYLYANADSINKVDPNGESAVMTVLGIALGMFVGVTVFYVNATLMSVATLSIQLLIITPLCYILAATGNEDAAGMALFLRYMMPGFGPIANAISHTFYYGDSWLPNLSKLIFDMRSVQDAVGRTKEQINNSRQFSGAIYDVMLNRPHGQNRRGETEEMSLLRTVLGTGTIKYQVNSQSQTTAGITYNVTWKYEDEFDAKDFKELWNDGEFRSYCNNEDRFE